jgi:enoyl-CoA hydratase/carnithine racemase
MTAFTRLRYEDARPAATITLARPEVRNAFDEALISELTEVFAGIKTAFASSPETSPRALVLAGDGPAFCAGADMNWMKRSVGFTREENEADAARFAAMLRAFDELPVPAIARVHGATLGGGMGLIACCDVVVAAETAEFGFTEVRLGIAPAVISAFVLPKIGAAAARRYFLTAEVFPAAVARAMGESDERMHLLNAWREAPIYSARERAALGWIEAVTLVAQGHVPDDVFETVRQEFSEKEIVDLTAAAIAINSWNRIAIAFRVPPQVESKKAAA